MSTCKMNEICTLQCGMLVAAPSDFVCLLKMHARGSHPGGRDAMACSFPWQRNHSSSAQSRGTAIRQTKVQVQMQKALGYAWASLNVLLPAHTHTHTSLGYPEKHCNISHTRARARQNYKGPKPAPLLNRQDKLFGK